MSLEGEKEEAGMPAHREKAMWGHSKKAATYKPRRNASGETDASMSELKL